MQKRQNARTISRHFRPSSSGRGYNGTERYSALSAFLR